MPKEASFEEVQDARNYLVEQYKWHEPSKEAIELAFDDILQERIRARQKLGFRPPKTGRRTDLVGETRVSLWQQFVSIFDPTITTRTLVNEALVFGAFAVWALFSADQSFPLAAAFGYSVYKFQDKRTKRNPDGPFFGGNAIVGALLATVANLAIACAAMAVVTNPLASLMGSTARQVGAFLVVMVTGVLNVYVK